MLALVAQVALGAPLVHEGDPSWAEDAAREHAGDVELTPRSWLSLTRSEPVVTSGDAPRGCRGEPLDRDGLERRLDAVRADFDWGDYGKAEDGARGVLDALPCLTQPVSTGALERAWRLLAVSRFHDGDEEGADEAFLALRGAVDDPGWDSSLPDRGRTRLESIAPRLPVPVTRVPEDSSVLLDGRTVDEVAPGPHLLQWRTAEGARGLWIEVPDDGVEIAMPAALRGRTLEEAIHDDLSGLDEVLVGTWGADTRVWLVSQRAIYRGTAGGPLEEVGLAPEPVSGRLRLSVPVLAVGAAGTAAGGVTSGLALLAVGSARADYASAATPQDAVDARDRFDAASAWVVPGQVTLAAGAGVLATGLLLHLGTDLAVSPTPSGLQLSGRL